MGSEMLVLIGSTAGALFAFLGVHSARQEKQKLADAVKNSEPPERIELSDHEMSNFNWLDTCPDCGKIDHHPFVPIEESGERYSIVTENVTGLAVVKRTCTRPKCGFTWYQK